MFFLFAVDLIYRYTIGHRGISVKKKIVDDTFKTFLGGSRLVADLFFSLFIYIFVILQRWLFVLF